MSRVSKSTTLFIGAPFRIRKNLGEVAAELHWFAPWTSVLEWKLPLAKWFVGGKINLCYNCVDRHALSNKKDKVAILWEGEPGETRKLTYGDLHLEVQKVANVLRAWASARATGSRCTWA